MYAKNEIKALEKYFIKRLLNFKSKRHLEHWNNR